MFTAEEILSRYRSAIVDLSADDLAELYAVDAVHEMPFLFPSMPDRLAGREQIRVAYRAAWAASDAQPREVRDVAVHSCQAGSVLVVEQVVLGHRRTTGEPFELPGVLVFHIHDGLLVRVRDYLDGLAVARAAGRLAAIVEALA
ncbi:nuclear transport factor 2 family protein [Kribbella pittospori]|uniref:Nuclear transport factor 2 family protein n=1 Tax=Kribbella pittospori TaxID=722689 RepID=A0A4R0KJU4_9ACTN|nr:nuclear transport factor 2 family protein [Kribbella pittospori]TCC60933.1 nuclear transport factor 2 family protein [Kribbella pittospori]